MRRFGVFILLLTAFVAFLPFTACDKHLLNTPFPPPTATPTATPVLLSVTLAGSLFNPAAVTILAGTGIVWTNTDPYPHMIASSDVTASCVGNPTIMGNGAALTMMYPTAGTCYVHCAFHSACGNTPCNASCEGAGLMTMRVVVQ